MDMLEILFRHQDFVAINKPGGISVHQDSGETGLARTLAIQLGVERVWLLHRLDKQTSGILLFALNKESASALSGQFAGKSIKKTYLALSDRKPSKKQGWIKGGMEKSRCGMWNVEVDAQYRKYRRYPIPQHQYRRKTAAVHPRTAYGQNAPIESGDEKFGQSDSGRQLIRRNRIRNHVSVCMENTI
ncbi:TPA: hypothetical protein WHN72_001885 [Neisseria meningitidis]